MATASHSDEFQSAIFQQFSKHISVFLGHPAGNAGEITQLWERNWHC